MRGQSDPAGHGHNGYPSTDEQTELEQRLRSEWEPSRQSYDEHNAQTEEFDETFDDFVDDLIRQESAKFQKNRARDDLADFSVRWDRIISEEAAELHNVVDSSEDERPVQDFLRDNPKFLVQALAGGHGRYQIAKPRFGSEYVPDFVVAEAHSFGLDWYLVEIESPRAVPFRGSDGLPSHAVHHAIGQIRDWREWLAGNRDYARKPLREKGLGLVGIEARSPGLILIGRRAKFPERFNEFRRAARAESGIVIHSYDWLLDLADKNRSGGLRFELLC